MELYLRSVEFIFLLLPMTTVDVYHMERGCLQFGMWEIQWVHCVLNDAEYADRKA